MPINKINKSKITKNNNQLFTIILLILSTQTLAADWVQVDTKYTWDRIPETGNFCATSNQCLVRASYNSQYDNQPEKFFSGNTNSEKPKCILTGQYILDNYCDFDWTSRTKLIAEHLLTIGFSQTPDDFSLYCDTASAVLNRYQYSTTYGLVSPIVTGNCAMTPTKIAPCINNICVLHYGTNTVVGTSMNNNIDGQKSILSALNQPTSLCNGAKNFDSDYDLCGNNIWYNHDTQSIIYGPVITSVPTATTAAKNLLSSKHTELKNYVFNEVHNPSVSQYNYTLFGVPPNYKQFYFAQSGNTQIYTFKTSAFGESQRDISGWKLQDITMPSNACDNIFIRYGGNANCKQDENEILIAAQYIPLGTPSLAQNWNQTVLLRVIP